MGLETMPAWAQEVVFNLAFGLVEDENAYWVYKVLDNRINPDRIIIHANDFTYTVTPRGVF